MKMMIATALVGTLAVGSAFAQSAATTANQATDAVTPPASSASTTSADSTVTAIPHLTADQITSSKIIGKAVYNASNEKIGDVSDLIVDQNGKVVGVVIGVGGFLGLGERNVAVTFPSVKFSKDAKGYEHITIAATKDQLKAMTPYDSKTNG